MSTYRRPGVYLEERLLTGPNDVGSASSVTLFAGSAVRGPSNVPVRCDSWSDYTANFGGFEAPPGVETAYLPYAVYSYFQNGGRVAYVSRAIAAATGTVAEYDIVGLDGDEEEANAFTVAATSSGEWGNELGVGIDIQQQADVDAGLVYTLVVYRRDSVGNYFEVERFSNLSSTGQLAGGQGIPGTKSVQQAVNDSEFGSKIIRVSDVDPAVLPSSTSNPVGLVGGTDGGVPEAGDLITAATRGVEGIDGPVIVNVAPHWEAGELSATKATVPPTSFAERADVFVVNDAADPRTASQNASDYKASLEGTTLATASPNSSYMASYTPWIVIPDPATPSATKLVPPGGAVCGVISRTDATEGIYRAPAGVIATITNALNVDARFSTSHQGDLNAVGINVIRPVPGAGIAIMGARTRKRFGVDRYISARRTLIYIKESLRISTQFAIFENNDERLWAQLRATADNVLRPIWSNNGLRGTTASEAYFVVCDETINTQAVIASGEVRMEVGVALEYPAEFIVIRVSQFEGGSSANVEVVG